MGSELESKKLKFYNEELYVMNIKNIITNKYGLDLSVITDLEHRAVVSGSSVIQAILSENWINSDLDIYINPDDLEAIRKKLTDSGYFENVPEENNRGLPYGNMKVVKFYKYRDIEANCNVKYFDAGERVRDRVLKIDIVMTDIPIDDFVNNFDLDICRNSFDGTTLKIGNIDSVLNKTAKYSDNDRWTKIKCESGLISLKQIRVDKYRYIGFKVT